MKKIQDFYNRTWITLRKILVVGVASLISCHSSHSDPNTLRVGTIAGPESVLIDTASQVALKKFGLHIIDVQFTDYALPNAALADGSLDANMFQHQPFLNQEVQNHHYKFGIIGKTFIYPMGIYSKKYTSISSIPNNATIAIPSDPSNEARALLLLQNAGLITLKSQRENITVLDIAQNPKHLAIKELDAAQLPRLLKEIDAAAINTNFAIPAGLQPHKDALFYEPSNSPYANILVVKINDINNPQMQQLLTALRSPEVVAKAKELFQDNAFMAW